MRHFYNNWTTLCNTFQHKHIHYFTQLLNKLSNISQTHTKALHTFTQLLQTNTNILRNCTTPSQLYINCSKLYTTSQNSTKLLTTSRNFTCLYIKTWHKHVHHFTRPNTFPNPLHSFSCLQISTARTQLYQTKNLQKYNTSRNSITFLKELCNTVTQLYIIIRNSTTLYKPDTTLHNFTQHSSTCYNTLQHFTFWKYNIVRQYTRLSTTFKSFHTNTNFTATLQYSYNNFTNNFTQLYTTLQKELLTQLLQTSTHFL